MKGASRVRRPSSMSAIRRDRWPISNISTAGAAAASSRGCSSDDIVSVLVCTREYTTMSQPATTETPKEASASVIAQHAATLKALPFSDVRDFDDAARGFLGTVESAQTTSRHARAVRSLAPYAGLSAEQATATVGPSLPPPSRPNMP